MTNGGFESNDPGGAGAPSNQVFTSAAVPGWDSTLNEIELWDSGFQSVPAHSGAVFAELNVALLSNVYYQNICLLNGETLRWSFAHRNRSGGAATQTVSLQVANTLGIVLQSLATQSTTLAQGWVVNSNTAGVTYTGSTGVRRVQLSTPDLGSVGNFLDSVELNLSPVIEFSAASPSGSETVPSANLPTLLVSGNVPTAFTVPVTVTGGSAILGVDYTTPGGGATFNVTIPAGNYSLQAIALGISAVNDTSLEPDETITLSVGTGSNHIISSTSSCGSSGQNTSTYTITNDDSARLPGTPPTLTCPVGTTLFDWDSRAWTTGATSANFAVTNIGNVAFNITNPDGVFVNNATYGGQSPLRQNVMTGGLTPAQFSLLQIVNLNSISSEATTTISLATAVPGAQFRIFDIDSNAGQYADRITVTGSYGGTTVIPTLTNGVSNFVSGNSALGDVVSADASSDGNVVVTFASPIDTIVIAYGNHNYAPADPGNQAMTIHDITFCTPQATLSFAKTSSVVSDPSNGTTDPKFIPGALVRYCLLVSNAGSAAATTVNMTDPLPSTTTFVPGSIRSGTSCAGATSMEDDDAAGADESDPHGASLSGTTITGVSAILASGAAFAIAFNAIIN